MLQTNVPASRSRQGLRRCLLRAALLAPAVVASVQAAAQVAGCRADAGPCCRSPAPSNNVMPTPPSFGVHIWPGGLTQASAIKQLIALKPRHLRFALGPNWRHQPPLQPQMTDAQLDTAVAAGFERSPLGAEIDVLRNLQARTGAMLHLVIWEPPPLPSEQEQRPSESTGRSMPSQDVPIVARFLIAALKHIAAQGLHLDAVELSNEPDGNWNISIVPEDYLALLKAVRAEGKRRAAALPKIYGPATSSLAPARRFLENPRVGRAIVDNVDVLSVHGWDNSKGRDRFLELDSLLDDLRRLQRKPELAITEYGLARPVPADSSNRMNVKKRTPNHVADTPFYGSISAGDLLGFYARGIGTIIHWEFQDQRWGKASFGLLDDDGKVRPIYRMMRSISEQLAAKKPDRVEQTGNGLFIAHQPGREVLWSVNVTDSPTDVLFDGARPVGKLPAGLQRCRGNVGEPGFTVAPWSIVSIPIERP
jgi:hypothetical protein